MTEKMVAELIGQMDAVRADPTWRGLVASDKDQDHYNAMELTAKITGLESTLQRMEPALARIDERLSHVVVKEDLAKLEGRLDSRMDKLEGGVGGRLDKLDERLKHTAAKEDLARLPTKGNLWGMIAAVLGTSVAIAGLTFVIADYASRM